MTKHPIFNLAILTECARFYESPRLYLTLVLSSYWWTGHHMTYYFVRTTDQLTKSQDFLFSKKSRVYLTVSGNLIIVHPDRIKVGDNNKVDSDVLNVVESERQVSQFIV